MAAQGGHPHTWLYVACLVLCGCGSKEPAATGGEPGPGNQDLLDSGVSSQPAADGGGPGAPPPADSGGPQARDAGCEPASCESLGASCGTADDGCGASLDCGSCGPGELCEDNQCRSCEPMSCASLGVSCGLADNGCGASLDCGACGTGEVCEDNQCRSCSARSCSELGWECGSGSDECGGTLDCGDCSASTANCVDHSCCTPRVCPIDACGELSDGCGGNLDCGPCPTLLPGKECGRVNTSVCLGPESDAQAICSCELPAICDPRNGSCCVPLTCPELCKTGAYNGSDGCGNTLQCASCR